MTTQPAYIPLKSAYGTLMSNDLIDRHYYRSYVLFRTRHPKFIYGVPFFVEKIRGEFMVDAELFAYTLQQALIEKEGRELIAEAFERAREARRAYIDKKYEQRILLPFADAKYVILSPDFHRLLIVDDEWKRQVRLSHSYVCSHCFKRASEIRTRDSCDVCTANEGCSDDCRLIAYQCIYCGTYEERILPSQVQPVEELEPITTEGEEHNNDHDNN